MTEEHLVRVTSVRPFIAITDVELFVCGPATLRKRPAKCNKGHPIRYEETLKV